MSSRTWPRRHLSTTPRETCHKSVTKSVGIAFLGERSVTVEVNEMSRSATPGVHELTVGETSVRAPVDHRATLEAILVLNRILEVSNAAKHPTGNFA